MDAAVRDEQLLGVRLRQDRGAGGLGLLAEEAAELRDRDDHVSVVAHRRRRRHAVCRPLRQDVDRLAVHVAVARKLLELLGPSLEEAPQRPGVDDRAGEEMRAGLLALLDDRDRDVAEPLGGLRRLFEQLAEPDRAGEAGRPRTDDQDSDLDPLVGGIRGRRDGLGRRERGRVVRWNDSSAAHPFRARTSSVSFGTIVWTSPTIPRSANSKMGAFASLLIATITFELCIPTLCWIAPEIPHAT